MLYRSRLFIPQLTHSQKPSKDLLSKSHRLFKENGVVETSGRGVLQFLPLGIRSLDKLRFIVEKQLDDTECQKMHLPSLSDVKLWKKSGRFDQLTGEVFTLKDKLGTELLLAPTHEEVVTQLVAKRQLMTTNQFPLRLYQSSYKFRDEMNPRFGLLRAKEFLMTDLYIFDTTKEAAALSYEKITKAYEVLFNQLLRLPVMRVLASSGTIGGSLSHEFHLPAPCGQDYIHYCQSCRSGDNEEVYSSLGVDCSSHHCQTCGITMDKIRTVEIAHSFILGQKYSQPLEATFLDSSGQQKFLEMSCYGIGTSRLLAAAVELLSSDKFIRWPEVIAPFTLAIIPPKSGSKEELAGGAAFTQDFAHHLLTTFPTLRGDILIDDRPLTVGKRLEETQRLGIPLIFVGAKSTMEIVPKFELFTYENVAPQLLSHAEAIQFMGDKLNKEKYKKQ